MENAVSTIYGAKLQASLLHGLPIVADPHSTLNEKFGIQTSVALPSGVVPAMRYIGIGNGGHTVSVDGTGVPTIGVYEHETTDACLFNQLPFILRLPSNDLTVLQAAKYRLRTQITIGGIAYIAYYLKVLDYTDTTVEMTLKTVASGVTTSTPFVPSNSNLNPTPSLTTSSSSLTGTANYISAAAITSFTLTADDINEIVNVSNIVYGKPDYAIASEIALCSGIEVTVTGTFNGVSRSYSELLNTQVVTFMESFYPLQYLNNVTINLDSGSTQPLPVTI